MTSLAERARAALDDRLWDDGEYERWTRTHIYAIREALELAGKAAPDESLARIARWALYEEEPEDLSSLPDGERKQWAIGFDRGYGAARRWVAEVGLAAAPKPPAPVVPEGEAMRLLREFGGWLSGDLPELHHVDLPRIADSLDRFLLAAAPKPEDRTTLPLDLTSSTHGQHKP